MTHADATPCRHRGTPSDELVDQVIRLLSELLPVDSAYLGAHGLTAEEYAGALPTAVQRFRGKMAASNQDRRTFVESVVRLMVKAGVVERYSTPNYGKDTVYRLFMRGGKQVGLVQKGCPDGEHSSVTWTRPEWADELYLWWVCDSKAYEPGEHIWKGVGRIRGKISAPGADQLDGVIFYDRLCGTPDRPCPKLERAVVFEGARLPPPCIYVYPHWESSKTSLNWRGELERSFPPLFLEAFGIPSGEASKFVGYVGFRIAGSTASTTEVTSHFGPAKSTTARG